MILINFISKFRNNLLCRKKHLLNNTNYFIKKSRFGKTKYEAQMLKKFKHSNIISFYGTNKDETRLVLEKGDIDLYYYIKNQDNFCISNNNTLIIAYHISQALEYIHNMNYSHNDIKPENIVLCNYNSNVTAKLIDFEFTTPISDYDSLIVYSDSYLSPEKRDYISFRMNPYCRKKADMWSLGIVLYLSTFGSLPTIINNNIDYITHECDVLEIIINGLLTIDPDKRLSSNDVVNIIRTFNI